MEPTIRARQVGHRMLLLRGPPGVDRVFTLTVSSEHIGNGDIHAVEPSVQALMRLVAEEASPSVPPLRVSGP